VRGESGRGARQGSAAFIGRGRKREGWQGNRRRSVVIGHDGNHGGGSF
jgi:hypothetical protein